MPDCVLEAPNFKIFLGEHTPGPPTMLAARFSGTTAPRFSFLDTSPAQTATFFQQPSISKHSESPALPPREVPKTALAWIIRLRARDAPISKFGSWRIPSDLASSRQQPENDFLPTRSLGFVGRPWDFGSAVIPLGIQRTGTDKPPEKHGNYG